MAKTLSLILLLSLLLMGALNFASLRKDTKMPKYEWLPSESAHVEYPMTIIDGVLYLQDGSSVNIPSKKIFNHGWGEIGSTHVVGNDVKSLPSKLEISWFSYAEDKFFTGTFALPHEQLSTLFSEGRTSAITGEKITYDTIIVGVAPAGEVSVWLQADGEVLLVSRFFGKEYVEEWSKVSDSDTYSRAEYIAEMLKGSLSKNQLERLHKDGVPFKDLELYRKKYNWTLQAAGQRETIAWMYSCNGEVEFFDFEKEQHRVNRSAPKRLDVIWLGRFGKWYEAKIALDDPEVLKAYEKLSSGDTHHNLELLVEVSDNNQVEVSLKDSRYILRLQHVSVRVYQLESAPIGKET